MAAWSARDARAGQGGAPARPGADVACQRAARQVCTRGGRDRRFIYAQLGAPPGREIDSRIERGTAARVISRWIDLGFIHLFGVDRPARRHEDIAGVRIAGGLGNEMRLRALGASPVVVPWPELNARLAQRAIGAALTS